MLHLTVINFGLHVLKLFIYLALAFMHEHSFLCVTSHLGQLSLAVPLWVDAMSTSQWAPMLYGWGVKAGMACVSWQVELCDPLYNMCHFMIPERLRGNVYDKCDDSLDCAAPPDTPD